MKSSKAVTFSFLLAVLPVELFSQASVERPNQVKADLAQVTQILKDESGRKDAFRRKMERISAELKSAEAQFNASSQGSDRRKLLAELIEQKLSEGLRAQFTYLEATSNARDRVIGLLNRVINAMPQDLQLKAKVEQKVRDVDQLVQDAEDERLRIAQLLLYSSATPQEKEILAAELEDAKSKKVDVLKGYAGFLGGFRDNLDNAGATMAGYRSRLSEMLRFIRSAATKLDVELDKIRLIAQSRNDLAGLRLQFVHLSEAIRAFAQLFSHDDIDQVGEWINGVFTNSDAMNAPLEEISRHSLENLDGANSDLLGVHRGSNVARATDEARQLLGKAKGDQ